ncbi:Uncharacterised protein [Vibrio cholerae]|nr:Uncharacterised protein [Vibrio cholerae]CSI75628.1 Uncharacterised protein [Vibrio cholerae]
MWMRLNLLLHIGVALLETHLDTTFFKLLIELGHFSLH